MHIPILIYFTWVGVPEYFQIDLKCFGAEV